MKYFRLFFLLVIAHSSYAQRLQYAPQNPKVGESITFTFTPDPALLAQGQLICRTAKLGRYVDLYGNYLSKGIGGPGWLQEVQLTKEGTSYKGTIQTDTTTRAIVLSFQYGDVQIKRTPDRKLAVTQGVVDTNQEQGYFIVLHTKEGRAREKANMLLGAYMGSFETYNMTGFFNQKRMIDFFDEEDKLYPSAETAAFRWAAYAMNTKDFMRMDTTEIYAKAKAMLNTLFQKPLTSEFDYIVASKALYCLGYQSLANYFDEQATQQFKNSNGYYAYQNKCARFDEIKNVDEQKKSLDSLLTIHARLPLYGLENSRWMYSPGILKNAYLLSLLKKDEATFEAQAKAWQMMPSQTGTSYFVGQVFNMLKEKNTADATRWADTWIGDTRQYPSREKEVERPYLPAKMREHQALDLYMNNAYSAYEFFKAHGDEARTTRYAYLAHDYLTQIQTKKGKLNSMYKPYSLVNDAYAQAITQHEKPEKAWVEVEKIIRSGIYSTSTKTTFETLYKKVKGEKGYAQYLTSLTASNRSELEKHMEEKRTNIALPNLKLARLSGDTLALASLKGKRVVLDFWATWCGPCIGSFPDMQKLVDMYRDDPNTVFLFVNTSEKGTKEEIQKRVAKFISSKGYRFDVLLDYNKAFAKALNITGLPTKSFVNKDLIVQYQLIGAPTTDTQLMDEVSFIMKRL